MGKARNQRNKNEGTFLEHVQDALMLLREDIVQIKNSIEGLKCLPGMVDPTAISHYSLSPWSSAQTWQGDYSYCSDDASCALSATRDAEYSWNALAQEFVPPPSVVQSCSQGSFLPAIGATSSSAIIEAPTPEYSRRQYCRHELVAYRGAVAQGATIIFARSLTANDQYSLRAPGTKQFI